MFKSDTNLVSAISLLNNSFILLFSFDSFFVDSVNLSAASEDSKNFSIKYPKPTTTNPIPVLAKAFFIVFTPVVNVAVATVAPFVTLI